MSKSLVTYFSPTGTTRKAAMSLSQEYGSDLFEIVPQVPYTIADLNWSDDNSRSSKEAKDEKSRPAIAKLPDVSAYQNVYIGYPIWWHIEPRIIDNMIEKVNLKDKDVHLFATSGGSRIDESRKHIEKLYPQLNIKDARLIKEEELW